jgi:hypothetical protein
MDKLPDRDAIADEAVGQMRGTAPPDSLREQANVSPEEVVRHVVPAPGVQARIPEKAASIGAQIGDACSDPGSVRLEQQGDVDRQPARSPDFRTASPIAPSRPEGKSFSGYPIDCGTRGSSAWLPPLAWASSPQPCFRAVGYDESRAAKP